MDMVDMMDVDMEIPMGADMVLLELMNADMINADMIGGDMIGGDMIDGDMGGNVEMERLAFQLHTSKILRGSLTVADVKELSSDIVNFMLYEWYFGTILNGVLVRLIAPSFDREDPLNLEQTQEFIRIVEYLCSVDSGCDILKRDYYGELPLKSTVFMNNENKYINAHTILHMLFVATVSRLLAWMYVVAIKLNMPFFALFEHKRQNAAASLIQKHYLTRYWTPPHGAGYKRLLFQYKSGLRLLPLRFKSTKKA